MGAEIPVKQRAKRPNKSEMEKRLADVFRLRLEGAGILNLLEYIREKELEPGSCWFLEPGEKPLSLRSIEHYIEQTNKQVREAFSKDRERILIEHRSRREWLYLKSVSVGDGENPDYRAALAILQDQARSRGFTPAAKRPIRMAIPAPLTSSPTKSFKRSFAIVDESKTYAGMCGFIRVYQSFGEERTHGRRCHGVHGTFSPHFREAK